ncbi:MAG: lipid-binding SYLF domain-containing protein [Acetobacteraceae bacterium]|nr:lipid-binding SYLF domain-containing protein [Acetobacteraceae bacterium]
MRRFLMASVLAAMPAVAWAQAEQQETVDRAALAAQDLLNDVNGKDAQSVLRRARAVMICPRVFKAGFLFGGQGGTCVLTARDAAGSWSSPAFYGLGGASFGFQAGMQDAEVAFLIMTQRGLTAIMDSQLKLGADAAATFVDLGGGVEGATTMAFNADVVGFSRARGLYAGVSLGGSMLSAKSDWNAAYYGRPVGVQQIVLTMEATNPAADPLRSILSRYGTQVAQNAPNRPTTLEQGPVNAPPPLRGSVQQQPLPPVQRRY